MFKNQFSIEKHKNYIFVPSRQLLSAVFLSTIILLVINCRHIRSDYSPDVCNVHIQKPTTFSFSEDENITFEADLESWDSDGLIEDGHISRVLWESDVDGILSSQKYNENAEVTHTFSKSNLTPGIHTITCYALDLLGYTLCSEQISIDIMESLSPKIDYLTFSFTLDEADLKTTYSNGAPDYYSKRIRHDLSSKCGESTFSDNIYTTIFDGRCSDSKTGYMTVTFLDNPRRVDVHAEWSWPSSDCISSYTVDYEGIPYDSPNGSASDLYVEYKSTVSRINVSQYDVVCTNNGIISTKELLNTNCGDDARIGVWVYYLE